MKLQKNNSRLNRIGRNHRQRVRGIGTLVRRRGRGTCPYDSYNLLGVHEYYGHYINHYHHKEGVLDATYFLQRNHYSWKKTTPQFKNYINSVIKQYAYE